jgi:2-iminobutanoate/2-iminopropanoate deaminase
VPVGPYAPIVVAEGGGALAFLSGQLPLDAVGEMSSGDVGVQTRVAMNNALRLLSTRGATASDIVKIVVYTTQLSQVELINAAYVEALGAARPARTMVEVSRLPRNALVEIDVVATLSPDRVSDI